MATCTEPARPDCDVTSGVVSAVPACYVSQMRQIEITDHDSWSQFNGTLTCPCPGCGRVMKSRFTPFVSQVRCTNKNCKRICLASMVLSLSTRVGEKQQYVLCPLR